ncbi:MAG: amidophosphoribosyltransferase [Anaeromicrobium sp.]|jgi:amidophosphoribosyltransferase|uniref:amidophosphoribosyltransferase n=1 Tax=Anaeromicrobium sp. TaxID=1929132 RepID=UPI0025DFDE13|nr:amidophosphoribosyltransferase [Anaeromicrobium sp.]MCT4593792.1 amidophosphoribosyltransferase [Anaeromicrobium sp.]
MILDKLKEECGVIGIYSDDEKITSQNIYYGLNAIQHRGQESAGILMNKNCSIKYYKEMGLVQDIFKEKILKDLCGKIGIGHVRYSTTGESLINNAQPLSIDYKDKTLGLAHNGNLINTKEIRDELEKEGCLFKTTIDSELIGILINKYTKDNIVEGIRRTMEKIKGAYALVITCEDKLIGVRDPHGLRPLVLGKNENGYILGSESCALNVLGADIVRNINPGEIVIIKGNEIESYNFTDEKSALCSFEFVYFARPDSEIDNQSVYMSRLNAGKILARECSVEADLVVDVPDSGRIAAMGYSQESNIPFAEGLIKNRYVGRTFIEPTQERRDMKVQLKLNPLKKIIEGKRIILVDDSIVRGTTMKNIVALLKKSGAREVHIRISSPSVKHSCFFGIDTPDESRLIGANNSVDNIRKIIGADSLAYLSIDGLKEACGDSNLNLCTACFNGNYPMEIGN